MKINHSLRKVKTHSGRHRILSIKNHEEISKTMCKNAWLDFMYLFAKQIERTYGEKCYLDYETLQTTYGESTEYFKQSNKEKRYDNPSQMFIRNAVNDSISARLVPAEEIYDILQELYAMMEAKSILANKSKFIKNDNGDFCDKREWCDTREWNAGVE